MFVFARLKPGVSSQQATNALQSLFEKSLSTAPPRFRKEIHLRVRSLRDRQVHDARTAACVLLAAVMAMLLIACANVAGLLLARAASRERELAVRSALGASRARLVRQMLTESLLLAGAGAVAGLLLGFALLRVFVTIAPDGIPLLQRAQLDFRIVSFTVMVSVVCGLLFGILPALQRPYSENLIPRAAIGVIHNRTRQLLVVAQIAISLVLLVCASLLLRSFNNIRNQPLGMSAARILSVSITLGEQRYPTPEKQMAFFQQAEARLRRLPGMNVLAISDSLPPGGWHHDRLLAAIRVAGQPLLTEGTGGNVGWRWVTPDYFRALGIPMVEGRNFREEERGARDHLAIVSRLLAERLFHGKDPVGEHVQPGMEGPWYTVIGVAENVKNGGLTGEDEPEYYLLRRNQADDWSRNAAFIIQTPIAAQTASNWIRGEIAGLDPTLPLRIETMDARIDEMAQAPRFESALLGLFAMVGLLLAAVGIYGVIAFMVAQRTQEIGVRMALGATRADVLKLMAVNGARLAVLGASIGLVGALLITRGLASSLFGVRPYDPLTFVEVVLLLLVVVLVATWIPARAATKVDPLEALRYQ